MIEHVSSESGATKATRELLGRIFPAYRETPDILPSAIACEPGYMIPLYVAPGQGEGGLSLAGSNLLTVENQLGVQAGLYIVMLMDLPSLARATAMGIGMSAPHLPVETGGLPTGEGVVIHACESLPRAAPSRIITFEGRSGTVAIHFHDHRSAKTEDHWKFSVELSGSIARRMIARALDGDRTNDIRAADAAARAKCVAKAVAGGLTSDLSASFFQAEFERSIAGARMTVASISVQDVIEALEDLLGASYDMVSPPPPATIKSAIARQLSLCTMTPEVIARNVAMSLIGENRVRAA